MMLAHCTKLTMVQYAGWLGTMVPAIRHRVSAETYQRWASDRRSALSNPPGKEEYETQRQAAE
jgi:hypothetical protein